MGALDLVRNTTYESCDRRPGLLFQCARDISDGFAKGDALPHILAHRESFGAPDPDKILCNKCTPTGALLLPPNGVRESTVVVVVVVV